MTTSGVRPKGPPAHDSIAIQCVFVTCFEHEFTFLATLLRSAAIHLHRAETSEEADFLLTVTDATVVLCDTLFLDGSWQNVMAMLASAHPTVASVVIADSIDTPYVLRAPEQGATAILWKPFRVGQLRRLIGVAHDSTRDRSHLHVNSLKTRECPVNPPALQ